MFLSSTARDFFSNVVHNKAKILLIVILISVFWLFPRSVFIPILVLTSPVLVLLLISGFVFTADEDLGGALTIISLIISVIYIAIALGGPASEVSIELKSETTVGEYEIKKFICRSDINKSLSMAVVEGISDKLINVYFAYCKNEVTSFDVATKHEVFALNKYKQGAYYVTYYTFGNSK